MQSQKRATLDFTKEIEPSKHFRNTWLRKWNWDINQLRSVLMGAKIEQAGTGKYKAFVKDKKGGKKIMFAYREDGIFIITGAEGK